MNINVLASLGVKRFDGIDRHGLLSLSSSIALGCRWLLIAKGSKFIQTQRATSGKRLMTMRLLDGRLSMRSGPDKAVAIPKVLWGKTIVLRSLKVNSHTLYMWYKDERECNDPKASFKVCQRC